MLHARVGAAAVVAAAVLHAMYVRQERRKAPTGRLLQFSPGSQDAIVAGRLKTGDVVLLARDPVLYAGAAGVAVAARQAGAGAGGGGGGHFDQVGVLLVRKGELCVAERTYAGVRVRPYEARVRASRSKEVVVRPLAGPLPAAAAKALADYVAAQEAASAADPLPPWVAEQVAACSELARRALRPTSNDAVDFVAAAYAAAGWPLSSASGAPVTLADFVPPAAPTPLQLQRPVWVRDLQ